MHDVDWVAVGGVFGMFVLPILILIHSLYRIVRNRRQVRAGTRMPPMGFRETFDAMAAGNHNDPVLASFLQGQRDQWAIARGGQAAVRVYQRRAWARTHR